MKAATRIFFFFLISMAVPLAGVRNDYTSKTIFIPLRMFTSTSPERTMHRLYNPFTHPKGHQQLIIQAIPLYSRTQKKRDLAAYFLPSGTSRVLASEYLGESAINYTADVISTYWGVETFPMAKCLQSRTPLTGESTLSFKAGQEVAGMGFGLTYSVNQHWFFEFFFPVLRVTNHLEMHEITMTLGNNNTLPLATPAGSFSRISQAFKGPYLIYGKIDGAKHSVEGIADIELTVGYRWVSHTRHMVASTLDLIIPTGTKPDPTYLFSPVLGNAQQWGIGATTSVQAPVYTYSTGFLTVTSSIAGTYSIPNTHVRSFDLKGRPWSRYLFVYPTRDAAQRLLQEITLKDPAHVSLFAHGYMQPAINFLTQPVHVKPGCTFEYQLALKIEDSQLTNELITAEIGMNAHYRQAERVSLVNSWSEGPAIPYVTSLYNGFIATASQAGIDGMGGSLGYDFDIVTGNPVYIPIQEEELDMTSAAHPATGTVSLWATIGYQSSSYADTQYGAHMGGAYEFSCSNTAFNRLRLWVQGELAF